MKNIWIAPSVEIQAKRPWKKLGSNKQLQGTVRCETRGKEIWPEHALVFSVKTVKTTKKQVEKKKSEYNEEKNYIFNPYTVFLLWK